MERRPPRWNVRSRRRTKFLDGISFDEVFQTRLSFYECTYNKSCKEVGEALARATCGFWPLILFSSTESGGEAKFTLLFFSLQRAAA